jgi:hypothetical protein
VGDNDSFGFFVAFLFDNEVGRAEFKRIDENMSKLPGLEGFDLVQRRIPEAGPEGRAAATQIAEARKRASELGAQARKTEDPLAALDLFRAALRLDAGLQPSLAPFMARAAAARALNVAEKGDYALGAALLEEAIGHDPTIRALVARNLTFCRAAVALQRMYRGDIPGGVEVQGQLFGSGPLGKQRAFSLPCGVFGFSQRRAKPVDVSSKSVRPVPQRVGTPGQLRDAKPVSFLLG